MSQKILMKLITSRFSKNKLTNKVSDKLIKAHGQNIILQINQVRLNILKKNLTIGKN